MDWPEYLELTLDGIAQGGDGVGRVDGRVVFASGGLPGERVRVRLTDRQAAFARGRVVDVIEAMPERVPSFCPLERICGAADWRWIDSAAQRRFKAAILREQLHKLAAIDVPVAPPPATPPLGYRTTADLHVAGSTIGYYRPGSRSVAEIPACCLHHPLINQALGALVPLLDRRVTLRDVTLRCSPETGMVLGVLDGRGPLRELARRWRSALPSLVGVTDARGRVIDGRNWIERRVGDLRVRVSARSFFQINANQVAPMVDRVRALLDLQPNDRLLDLYCGGGLFALSCTATAESVVGVEEWQPAVDDAIASARDNGIANATFHVGKAEQIVASIDGPIDCVVLDPPRRGCAPEVLDALAARRPRRIVYVSCHPGTLARDCRQLAAHYAIRSAEVIDMFPQTSHVESIVCLDRRG